MKTMVIAELIKQAMANYIAAHETMALVNTAKIRRGFLRSTLRLIKLATSTENGKDLLSKLIYGGEIELKTDEQIEEMIQINKLTMKSIEYGLKLFLEGARIAIKEVVIP